MEQRKKEPRYPVALDKNGKPIPPYLASPGEIYDAPCCTTAKLQCINYSRGDDYYRKVRGTVHTGLYCRDCTAIKLIDIERVLKNSTRETKKEKGEPAHPGKPKQPSGNLILCASLEDIRELGIAEMDDYKLDDGSMLTDHFVGNRNAYCILDSNRPLGGRALEVELDYCYDLSKTIRCKIKAHKGQNGKPTAAKMVLDLVCADDQTYQTACRRYFYRYWDPNHEKWRYLPKYQSAYIVGEFAAVPNESCHSQKSCTSWCLGEHLHCVGRQKAALVCPRKQINVLESDIIDLPLYLNGWCENS